MLRIICLVLSIVYATTARAITEEEGARFFEVYVQPNLTAYENCASQHLIGLANNSQNYKFDDIESSIRPVCGNYMDAIRKYLLEIGIEKSKANQLIAEWYGAIQPRLRNAYEQQKNTVSNKTLADKGLGENSESKSERDKLLNQAIGDHSNCVISQMREIVPYSNEKAETLSEVIITKCSDLEKRIVSLGLAFYGGSKSDMNEIVQTALNQKKKNIVAEIVTFRANLVKGYQDNSHSLQQDNANKISPANGF